MRVRNLAGGDDMDYKNSKLFTKAIAAYEQSDLRRQDVLGNQEAIEKIRQFLRKYDPDVQVTSNPFEIDGVRFYSHTLGIEDAELGYMVRASRECPDCHERRVFDAVR